jgi:membrane fusion protein, multidrug efflux system
VRAQQSVPEPTVNVIRAASQKVPVYIEYVGTTDSRDTVAVNARVDGYIEKRLFETGQDVAAGQLLYVIDQRPYRAEFQKAKAELARAEAQLVYAREGVELLRAQSQLAQSEARLIKARQDVDRVKPLVAQNALPEQDLDQANANLRVAEAEVRANKAAVDQQRLTQRSDIDQSAAAVESAKAALRTAELNLEYTEIRASVAGRMGESNARVGSLASRSSAEPLTLLSPLDPIQVRFKVSERDYLEYIRRMIAEQNTSDVNRARHPTAQLMLADGSQYPAPGRFRSVERAIDLKTGTLEVTADFPNPRRVLLPGQFGRVRMLSREKSGVYLIPQRAVQETQGTRSVLIVRPDGTVAARTVQASDRIGNLWVVEKGIQDGDHVIVDGLMKARPGSKVKTKLEPGPALAQSQATAR